MRYEYILHLCDYTDIQKPILIETLKGSLDATCSEQVVQKIKSDLSNERIAFKTLKNPNHIPTIITISQKKTETTNQRRTTR